MGPRGVNAIRAARAPPSPLVPKLLGELSEPIGWSLPHRRKRKGPARRWGGNCSWFSQFSSISKKYCLTLPPCLPAQRRQRLTRLLSRWRARRAAFAATQPTTAGNFWGPGKKSLTLGAWRGTGPPKSGAGPRVACPNAVWAVQPPPAARVLQLLGELSGPIGSVPRPRRAGTGPARHWGGSICTWTA